MLRKQRSFAVGDSTPGSCLLFTSRQVFTSFGYTDLQIDLFLKLPPTARGCCSLNVHTTPVRTIRRVSCSSGRIARQKGVLRNGRLPKCAGWEFSYHLGQSCSGVAEATSKCECALATRTTCCTFDRLNDTISGVQESIDSFSSKYDTLPSMATVHEQAVKTSRYEVTAPTESMSSQTSEIERFLLNLKNLE